VLDSDFLIDENYVYFDRESIVKITNTSSVEEFQEALGLWYSQGKPLSLLYGLAQKEETDISYLISTDNFIKVDGNGSVVMQNEGKKAVPSTIEYQLS
jgi:hypothetical protein